MTVTCGQGGVLPRSGAAEGSAVGGGQLLVVGVDGTTAGVAALRCAHHATCPLVLVPAPEETAPGEPDEP